MKKNIVSMFACLLIASFSVGAVAQDVHSVGSDQPLALYDYDTGTSYSAPNLDGEAVVSWFDGTDSAYFYAVLRPTTSPMFLEYEFELVDVTGSNDDEIWGLWNIWKNGVLVVSNSTGHAYNLDQPAGCFTCYFKVYIDDSPISPSKKQWHMSAYIIDRFDY